jgi:hypothetical protein
MGGRIRTLKPEWLEDELLAAASDEARVLSVALILMADDYGRGRANIATIAAEAWRFAMAREDGAHAAEVLARASRAFRELLAMRFVVAYEVDRQRYFAIRNWDKHQKVDRPSKARIPAPPDEETLIDSDTREDSSRGSRDTREGIARHSRLTCTSDLYHRPPTTREDATGLGAVEPGGPEPEPLPDGIDPTFNRRSLERAVSERRGKPWSVPTNRYAMAARADAVVEEIRSFAARERAAPWDVCGDAFASWEARQRSTKRSTEPHLWLDDWAGALPVAGPKAEAWRDLEG